jgi:hypothetical protein
MIKVKIQGHPLVYLAQGRVLPVHAVHDAARAPGVLQVVKLASEGIDFRPQRLNFILHVGLDRLKLPQLRVLLLYLLFQIPALHGRGGKNTGVHVYGGAQKGQAKEETMRTHINLSV